MTSGSEVSLSIGEAVFSPSPMWHRPDWSCDLRYSNHGLRSNSRVNQVWRVTGSLSLLPISLTVEPMPGY